MVMQVSPADEIEIGMSATRLGEVFDLDPKTVKALLKDVDPDGDRHGAVFWRIATAAPYLVVPTGNLEDYIRRLKPSDLPAKFQKEFWAALNLRTKYYKDRSALWSTEQVYAVLSEILKIVRSTSRLFVDELESVATLTHQHRKAIQIEMDKMLALMREKIKEAFQNYDATQDHVESLEVNNDVEQTLARDEDQPGDTVDGEEEDVNAWLDNL
jgi:Protein of unknown function (DUF1441).